MPMKSQAQRGFLWTHHPKIAKKFEKETPEGIKLPEKLGKKTVKRKKPSKSTKKSSRRKTSKSMHRK